MMKFMALAAVGALCVVGTASAKDAASAQLSGVTGAVMIQQSGKMVAASNASALSAGDRVVAMKDGKAQVKFADGCVVDLKAGSMITVSAKSPCASGAGVVSTTQAAPAELIDTSDPLKILGYGAGAGALIWGLSEMTNHNDSPTSP